MDSASNEKGGNHFAKVEEMRRNDAVDIEADLLTIKCLQDLLAHVQGRDRPANASMQVSTLMRVLFSVLEAYTPEEIPAEFDVKAVLSTMRDDTRFEPIAQAAVDATTASMRGQKKCSRPTRKPATTLPVGASLTLDASMPDLTNVLAAAGTPLLMVPLLSTLMLYVYKVMRRLRNGATVMEALSRVGSQEIGSILLSLVMTVVSVQMASNLPFQAAFAVALRQSIPPALSLQDVSDRLAEPTSALILDAMDSLPLPSWATQMWRGSFDWSAREIRYGLARMSNQTSALGYDSLQLPRDIFNDLVCTPEADLQFAALDSWIIQVQTARGYYRKLRYAKWALAALTPLFNLLFAERGRAYMAALWGHDARSVRETQEKLANARDRLEGMVAHSRLRFLHTHPLRDRSAFCSLLPPAVRRKRRATPHHSEQSHRQPTSSSIARVACTRITCCWKSPWHL